MGTFRIITALGLAGALSACGDTVTEQTIGGAAIGAGAAVLVSGSVLQGAAIGAGANLLACQTELVRCK
ncbi:hypothetical protein [uncultured Sulfitobacter sp.]|uniref:hypothetical protein n=1 Tax=uncultured Sulfitobacter sp. TaxID=191468 RepID=UPI00261D6E03|nr:hypothetical protein [uncultured Sulfitobacter sp.]